jgi:hypothetical protein
VGHAVAHSGVVTLPAQSDVLDLQDAVLHGFYLPPPDIPELVVTSTPGAKPGADRVVEM